ncbi:heme-binding protein [Pseudomonas sp. PDNC002]|uniref:heme-binding protein n=1 Tax=Pseudomonas sp. PDNC002 TaxID=2811422 RepID=UPI0019666D33|nr:heme-binding protein [Pseudomonas sp. PDNC002]QRY79332.1 heme-binding protein [Pseudomonas sp. PDNC002]
MKQKPQLTQQETDHLLRTARQEAQRNQWPVSIAIVDDGGHLLAFERLDGCAPIAAYIATEKARTAALGRRDSAAYESMINQGRSAFLCVPELRGMLEGGVPVRVADQVIGAIGVSGVKAEQDAQVARVAATSLEAG